jgi:WD40 repeat protein
MSRVFLSHSSTDNFEAIALRGWLASEGWSDVFLDLDPERGIAAGERWERALHDAASRCEAVIFLVSANWLGSGWCTKEYALARGLNKKLFAALTDPTMTIASLPDELTGVWQIVDLVHGQDLSLFPAQLPGSYEERHIGYSQSGLLRLKRGLEKAGLDARFFPWPPEREPDRAPYRGLRPQDADDAGIFFGRDAPIVEAIDRLRGLRAGAPPRLIAILGASGAGKSSFLRAGLLPRLNRDDAQFIPLPVVRPGRAALTGETGLVNALAAILPARSRADLRAAAQAGAAALRPLLAELVQAAAARRVAGDESERPPAFVIAIDQAEELFRADGREESQSLLALLADLAAGDDPTVIVIFTIRSDSYDALQSAKALGGLRQVAFSLLPMPRGAYSEVIEGPARRVEEAGGKLAIEPTLTQRLLVDIEAGAGDALPLLAFTLEQLYLDYRQTGALRFVDYEKFGGLKGAIDAAVERALQRADADPRIPRDRDARLVLLRHGLIPWLAGVDPDSKTPRRTIARHSDIPPEAAPLIDLLVEERLLSVNARATRDPKTGEETRQSTIEPAHEALLRQWSLLDGWLTEDFALLATLEGVKRASRDWDANARGDSWLAHQSQRLTEALALGARPDIASRLDATDRAYLAGCREREDAVHAEAEQRRREREEEQARKLADARKILFRTVVGAVVAVLFAIAAGAFGVYAFQEWKVAGQKTVEAVRNRSVALISLADAEADKHPVKAAKQALALWRAEPGDTSNDSAILDVLGHSIPNLRELLVFSYAGRDADAGTFLAFSPDARRIVTTADSSTAQVWDAYSGARLAKLEEHQGTVTSAVFSADGKRIVTTSEDGTARIWDVDAAPARAIVSLKADDGPIIMAAISPDGTRVVTTSGDTATSPTLRLWDATNGRALAKLRDYDEKVNSASFSPDGTRIVTTSDDTTARLWDAATGRSIVALAGHESPVASSAFSRDGKLIVTASKDKTARVWDAYSGAFLLALEGHDDEVSSAAFSPDGKRVVTASNDNTARVWDVASGRAIVLAGHKSQVNCAVFSEDGERVLTTSDDGTARLWDLSSGRTLATLTGHEGKVNCAAFSENGTRVVTASDDKTVRLWDVGMGRVLQEFEGHRGKVLSAAFSPDGRLIVTASDDGTARVWGQTIVTLYAGFGDRRHNEINRVNFANFSPDGKRVVTASDNKSAQIWDATTGAPIGQPMWHDEVVNYAIFSPDGTQVATASEDGIARIWNADTGQLSAKLEGHEDGLWSVDFSPDGTRVVTASKDRTARVWNVASKHEIRRLRLQHEEPVDYAGFSPDGTRIVTAAEDSFARLWDAASGHPVATLKGHEQWVNLAAFSPDGTRIATASADGTARIWDAASGRAIATLAGHGGAVETVDFSKDGTRIVTASDDETVRIWDVSSIPKGNILQVACKLLNGNYSLDGVTDYQQPFDRPICANDPPPPDLIAGPAAPATAAK